MYHSSTLRAAEFGKVATIIQAQPLLHDFLHAASLSTVQLKVRGQQMQSALGTFISSIQSYLDFKYRNSSGSYMSLNWRRTINRKKVSDEFLDFQAHQKSVKHPTEKSYRQIELEFRKSILAFLAKLQSFWSQLEQAFSGLSHLVNLHPAALPSNGQTQLLTEKSPMIDILINSQDKLQREARNLEHWQNATRATMRHWNEARRLEAMLFGLLESWLLNPQSIAADWEKDRTLVSIRTGKDDATQSVASDLDSLCQFQTQCRIRCTEIRDAISVYKSQLRKSPSSTSQFQHLFNSIYNANFELRQHQLAFLAAYFSKSFKNFQFVCTRQESAYARLLVADAPSRSMTLVDMRGVQIPHVEEQENEVDDYILELLNDYVEASPPPYAELQMNPHPPDVQRSLQYSRRYIPSAPPMKPAPPIPMYKLG